MTRRKLVDEGFASVADAARYLALSKGRVYELVHGGALSHAKLGGKIVLPWAALKTYARQRVVQGAVA